MRGSGRLLSVFAPPRSICETIRGAGGRYLATARTRSSRQPLVRTVGSSSSIVRARIATAASIAGAHSTLATRVRRSSTIAIEDTLAEMADQYPSEALLPKAETQVR